MNHLVGTYLGQYYLVELVGRGGMATVFKAYQASLERHVAVKVLQHAHDPKFAARFKREALASARLQHPYILPVYDYGEQDDLLYLVLQYVERGTTLCDLPDGPIEPARALRLIGHVADALDYAHKRGVIHRDIKPANILMRTPEWPLLSDFGIAKLVDETGPLTQAGVLLGTAAYMAPEQATGHPADARTDLYAIGVVLYELLTGGLPFYSPEPVALLHQHVYDPLPRPRDLNPLLPVAAEQILLRALAKQPAARYQTAAEMAAELARAADQLDRVPAQAAAPAMSTAVPGASEKSRPPRDLPAARRRAPVATALVLGLALLGGGGGIIWASQHEDAPAGQVAVDRPTSTATSTPTGTPAPTATSAPAPTATGTPTSAPAEAPAIATPTAQPPRAVASDTLNLRAGPGQAYALLALYEQGTAFDPIGRNEEATWLRVRGPDGKVGWMAAKYLRLNVGISDIPVVAVPPPPTATPTARATSRPTARPTAAAPAPPEATAPPAPTTPPEATAPPAPAPTEAPAPPPEQPKPTSTPRPTRRPEPTPPPRREPTVPPR